MTKITTLGIDIAKNVFQIACFNAHNKLISNKQYTRKKFSHYVSTLRPCLVGLEACGSAHYWSKYLSQQGHQVKLLPPVFVKGFVYGNKHDSNDAKAIGLAVMQPDVPKVVCKTDAQLALQVRLRIRERRINQRTVLVNQIRALCYEFGITIPTGIGHVRRLDSTQVPEIIREDIMQIWHEFKPLDQLILSCDRQINHRMQTHPIAQKLLCIPGIGPINALACLILNPTEFRNGRHLAAYLGLVPRLTGTGGKTIVLGISKRGNSYHRYLLCHAARSVLNLAHNRQDPLSQWASQIRRKRGFKIALVALANKLARIIYHVLQGNDYQPSLAASV